MCQLSLGSRLLESKAELFPTTAWAGPHPTLCLPEADRVAGEASISPLLPVGTGSDRQAMTGGTTFSREDGSLIPVGCLGVLPCWRNWFRGLAA